MLSGYPVNGCLENVSLKETRLFSLLLFVTVEGNYFSAQCAVAVTLERPCHTWVISNLKLKELSFCCLILKLPFVFDSHCIGGLLGGDKTNSSTEVPLMETSLTSGQLVELFTDSTLHRISIP